MTPRTSRNQAPLAGEGTAAAAATAAGTATGAAAGAGLTVGELARRTGLNAPTLRMWEVRYGFPVPQRLPSGHRRYDDRTVDLVTQVLRRRDGGVRLETAIGEVSAVAREPTPSVFAELRRSQPDLQPQRLRKATLIALSRALEDECCARAQRPWLFGAFQQERYYRRSESRWTDLSRTARGTWVMAELPFAQAAEERSGEGPVLVGLPPSAEMTREWSVVCLAADLPAALSAWELPGQDGVAEGDRLFESVWTVAPGPVRDAARCCARVVADLGPDTSAVLQDADRPVSAGSGDLGQAVTLFNRVLSYVDGTA